MMCGRKISGLFLWLTFVMLSSDSGTADYVVKVQVKSYSNPTNHRLGGVCCDPGPESNCTGNRRCDNYFTFCLRPLNTLITVRRCNHTPPIISKVAENDASIDFTQSTFLGLPNPLNITASGPWQGIQLYMEVNDKNHINGTVLEDDFVDSFRTDIDTSVRINRGRTTLGPGRAGIGDFVISVTVQCAEYFFGNECQYNIMNLMDICVNNSILCNRHGECLIDTEMNAFTCNCDLGYTGSRCETNTDDCDGRNCSGNGQCRDSIGSYSCECNSGFTGRNCEANIDDCIARSCSGNDVCVDGVNNYSCVCRSGYTGSDCETNINDCEDQNCNMNGKCIDNVDYYACECYSGFTGKNCETNINDCVGQDCSGNGQCLDGINLYRCDCTPGFTGTHCERFNHCAGVNCSGNGQCFNRENNFTCICYHGFTGDMCNIRLQAKDTSLGTVAVGGLVGGLTVLALIIIILLVIIVFLVRYLSRSTKTATDRSRDNPTVGSEQPLEQDRRSTMHSDTVTFGNPIYGSVTSLKEHR